MSRVILHHCWTNYYSIHSQFKFPFSKQALNIKPVFIERSITLTTGKHGWLTVISLLPFLQWLITLITSTWFYYQLLYALQDKNFQLYHLREKAVAVQMWKDLENRSLGMYEIRKQDVTQAVAPVRVLPVPCRNTLFFYFSRIYTLIHRQASH